MRGHAPPGIMTPTDISVIGPMARHAKDLDLALRALAGPDLLQRTAWRVELPPPRRRRLGEFRVAVWSSSLLCQIDTSVSDLFDRAIDEDFSRQQEIAGTLTNDDMSDRAAVARGATLLHRAWGSANEARTKLRYTWHEFFKRFDVLLTPVAATAAFPQPQPKSRETYGRRQRQVGTVCGAVILCGARQLVVPAGNRGANRLNRRGITRGPADHRAGGRGPDDDRIRPAARGADRRLRAAADIRVARPRRAPIDNAPKCSALILNGELATLPKHSGPILNRCNARLVGYAPLRRSLNHE
jgi:hypothetical protein